MLKFVCPNCGAPLNVYPIFCPECEKPFTKYGEDGSISINLKMVGDEESFRSFSRALERRLDPEYFSMLCGLQPTDYQEYLFQRIRESVAAYLPKRDPHPLTDAIEKIELSRKVRGIKE